MELKNFLFLIVGLSLCGFVLLYGFGRYMASREEQHGSPVAGGSRTTIQWIRGKFTAFLHRSYAISMKIPPLRYYVVKVRFRIAALHVYDEFELRKETMKFVYLLSGSFVSVIAVLTAMNPGLFFLLSLLIASAVIQGLLLDGYVNRLEKKLLEQMLDLFTAVRLSYHRHGIVSDAIEESIEGLPPEIALHATMIYEALSDGKPDEALERYYETAPNRFLKAFAGISRMVMEFGDRKKEKGSLYLRGLSSLTGEIQLELIRRGKLDHLLKGLNLIALVPFFFTKPIEIWARRNFPLMDQFYLSKAGVMIKIGLVLIILVCYMLLQKMKGEEETAYRAGNSKVPWEIRVNRWIFVRKLSLRFAPRPSSSAYGSVQRLLKDTNQQLSVEFFQIRRIAMFVLCTLVVSGTLYFLHWKSINWIMNEPPASYVFFGTMSKEDAKEAAKAVELDKQVMRTIGKTKASDIDMIAANVTEAWKETGSLKDKSMLASIVERIKGKLDRSNNEYTKWWELLLALFGGVIGYYAPLWVLMFQRKMRLMDMRHEVYQFQNMLTILRELERISVEEILEWLHSYAVIFKIPLQKCLLHYGHGGEEALRQMKEEAGLDEFRQLADKLLLAAEKITIYDAFDELENEMAYHFERRRIDYEKSLDNKAGIGRFIGFAPMYCLVFAYLVIPLVWMSFQQMSIYFEQIQHI
ncbi:hypothetical protein DFP94_1011133 [Fontibacillus phaseoli]|uniref:Uncharacterized protein n=1 Tax=Fontibacillus phaseoli TaxID=1416533 RepID=A0A369BV94_9BACL|nr:hypothetical protein [Fontibacillus phaseoli]RCX23534.1 hypothetical protein DFP94_1011133 [Fontibacillus phaseoli]